MKKTISFHSGIQRFYYVEIICVGFLFLGFFSFVDVNDDVCKSFSGARIVVHWTMISWWRYYDIFVNCIFLLTKEKMENAANKNSEQKCAI